MEFKMKAIISPRIVLENRTRLETVIPLSTPFILFLDPSSTCNFRCKFCPTGDHELIKNTGRFQGQMSLDLYKKIIDDLEEFDKPLKVLRLYKDGEPLLNKNLAKMVKYAKDSGHVNYIDTTTNGLLINNFRLKPIIDAGIDKINISVNGLSNEQFLDFTRTHVNFNKYVQNINDLYQIKGNCEIVIKIVGDTLSEDEKLFFYNIFGDICDKIFIENTAPCWSGFDIESHADIKISKTKGIYNNELSNTNVCPYIFYMISINSDGSVSLCFLDWERKLIIGDVRNQTVKQIWDSSNLLLYQLNNLSGKRKDNDVCKKCGQLTYCMPDNIEPYKEEILKNILRKKVND